jgi:hypothetical protein
MLLQEWSSVVDTLLCNIKCRGSLTHGQEAPLSSSFGSFVFHPGIQMDNLQPLTHESCEIWNICPYLSLAFGKPLTLHLFTLMGCYFMVWEVRSLYVKAICSIGYIWTAFLQLHFVSCSELFCIICCQPQSCHLFCLDSVTDSRVSIEKKTVALVREQTKPTEWLPLVDKVSANSCE